MCLQVHSLSPDGKAREILKFSFLQREGVCISHRASHFSHTYFSQLFRELQLLARDIPKGKKQDFEVLPNTVHCYAPGHSLRIPWAAGVGVQIRRWQSSYFYVALYMGNTGPVPQ